MATWPDKLTFGLWRRMRSSSRDVEISEKLHGGGQSSFAFESQYSSNNRNRAFKRFIPRAVADKWLQWSADPAHRRHEYKYGNIPKNIIHPLNPWYISWWYFTVILTSFTSWLIPFLIAFANQAGFYPYGSGGSILLYIITLAFAADIAINFSLARYSKAGELITDRPGIAREYLRLYFWLDIVSIVPWSQIAITFAGRANGPIDNLALWLNLFKLFYLLQMYRLQKFFGSIRFNLNLSLLLVTLCRNMALILFVQNLFGCAFYFVARLYDFSEYTWVGRMQPWFEGASSESTFDMYVYSVYWSIATLATVGYGGIHPFLVAECILVTFYITLNIFLIAYLTGTVTKVVIRGDEKVGLYRDRMRALVKFDDMHGLPKGLRDDMSNHLNLQFENERASDEAVLRGYPSTIRRRVLRHLYMSPLQRAYLFTGCKIRYLDAILALSRVELYLPRVEIVQEGDFVNELFIMVSGELESFSQHTSLFNGGSDSNVVDVLVNAPSILGRQGQRHSLLTEGDVFGEVAFLTGSAQSETIKTITVCRVLVVQRADFDQISLAFPEDSRKVLENLLQRAEQLAAREPPPQYLATASLRSAGSVTAPQHDADEREMQEIPVQVPSANPSQIQEAYHVHHVKQLVEGHVSQHNEERAGEFLNAALRGDNARLRKMLSQGFDVNIRNFDGRTALMLACSRGLRTTVELLLTSGADCNAVDVNEGTAMWEACRSSISHVDCGLVDLLRRHGARLAPTGERETSLLCMAAANGNLKLLQQLLQSGVDVNGVGSNGSTALQLAVVSGNMAAVRLLVEDGGASLTLVDVSGRTALQTAQLTQNNAISVYLEQKTTS